MDYKVVLAFALPLGLSIIAVGCAISLGKAVSSGLEATGRQPEAAMKILINMATGCAFIEAITIYALIFVLIVAGKI